VETRFDSFAFIILAGAAQAALVSLALAGQTPQRARQSSAAGKRMLCGLAACLVIVQVGSALLHTRLVLDAPHLAQLHVPFQFLLAPFVLFYARAMAGPAPLANRWTWLHFLPAAIVFLLLIPFYVLGTAPKLAYLRAALDDYPPEWRVRQAALLVQTGIYMAAAVRLIRGALLRTGKPRRPEERMRLGWLAVFAFSMALTWVAAVARYVTDYSVRTIYVVPSAISAFIFALAYVGLRNPRTLSEMPPAAGPSGELLAALRRVMERERLYLDPGLSLNSLAARLDTNAHRLSQAINDGARQSFTDFVNAYRTAEAQRRLADPCSMHLTIEAIGAECGFGSKTAFYQAFRKATGQTPFQARKLPPTGVDS
jgi:AraC-like DNA-binding protein